MHGIFLDTNGFKAYLAVYDYFYFFGGHLRGHFVDGFDPCFRYMAPGGIHSRVVFTMVGVILL
jgi:hypothetical protein